MQKSQQGVQPSPHSVIYTMAILIITFIDLITNLHRTSPARTLSHNHSPFGGSYAVQSSTDLSPQTTLSMYQMQQAGSLEVSMRFIISQVSHFMALFSFRRSWQWHPVGHFTIFIFVYKLATPSTIFTPTDVNCSPPQSDK